MENFVHVLMVSNLSIFLELATVMVVIELLSLPCLGLVHGLLLLGCINTSLQCYWVLFILCSNLEPKIVLHFLYLKMF